MTRHINRLYNYGVKGFLGTLVILFLFPIACLFISSASLFIAVTAFIWLVTLKNVLIFTVIKTYRLTNQLFSRMPIVTLALYAFEAPVCDLDSPDSSRNRYLVVMEALIWNIGIQGCLQPIAALFIAAIVCPLISFVILTGKIK